MLHVYDNRPPLKPLHPDESLLQLKLDRFRNVTTIDLVESLALGSLGSLKTRLDGTIVDGHHRIKVLRERNFDVDKLPRDAIPWS